MDALEKGAVSDSQFTFYWRDGKRQLLNGRDAADALNRAGYGHGALRALDFYAPGVDRDYDWDYQLRTWKKTA